MSAELAYLAPSFDGDSIWNVFSTGAFRDVRAGYEVQLGQSWSAHLRGFQRVYLESTNATGSRRTPGCTC